MERAERSGTLRDETRGTDGAIVITCVAFFPSCLMAYTFPAVRVETKSVPSSPSAMERASFTPSANTSIWNPGGSLMRSSSMRAVAAVHASSDTARAATVFMRFSGI